ncbi:hypothetical protein AK830_g9098 [Neonectria ditissima]|uniref:NYN domain-containing protein n=1 Tax=Neonectria ditissima TaxID=78410 RepID=A0A0P7AVM0_9HYPO|nr:hypothetical protein AK830_g9098 [Neonectria ditissima]
MSIKSNQTSPAPRGDKPQNSPRSSSRTKSQKLGDFGRLQLLSSHSPIALGPDLSCSRGSDSCGEASPSPSSRCKESVPAEAEKLVKLGNFSKIFDQFAASGSSKPPPQFSSSSSDETAAISIATRFLPTESAPVAVPIEVSPRKASPKKAAPKKTSLNQASPKKTSAKKSSSGYESNTGSGSGSGTNSGSDSDLEPLYSYSTPATTPSSSAERDPSPLAKFAKFKARPPKSKKSATASQLVTITRTKSQGQFQQVLAYQYHNYGPTTPVFDSVPTKDAKHESLAKKLIKEQVLDRVLGFQKPNVESNGVHVFIDMSNISISFLKAIRTRYSLPESVRLTPLPALNLSFLHELLARGRDTKVLNAGCSMRPDRAEPAYIQDLRDLGYRVDLRHRKPGQHAQGAQNPVEIHGTSGPTHYVEDMVDETLQIRIGESVMQYFDKPGTLVLATGDARPAKFSDGFFTYAERALKMGWNVEVVSWKASLSGSWTNRAWAEPWGDRFRVIELDVYIDDLLACYAA